MALQGPLYTCTHTHTCTLIAVSCLQRWNWKDVGHGTNLHALIVGHNGSLNKAEVVASHGFHAATLKFRTSCEVLIL